MKTDASFLGLGLVIWVAVVALAVGVFWTGYALDWWLAPAKGRLEARQEIQSGRFRLAAYERFFDLCSAVQADEGRIDALDAELAELEPETTRAVQVRASITAVSASRAEKIRRYNNDVAKDYTIGQFRDADLPYSLDPTEEQTTCVS